MGVENNECVIATTWDNKAMDKVKQWVAKINSESWQSLFVFVPGIVNDKETVILAPCGSKKGWEEDKEIEYLRNSFIEYLETFNYEDGSNPFDYVEVGYGSFGQKVLRGNCTNRYDDREYAA